MPDTGKVITRMRRKLNQQGEVISATVDRVETLDRVSPAKMRSIEAGRMNLARWRASGQSRSSAANAKAATDAFRASLEAGAELSALERILSDGICSTY